MNFDFKKTISRFHYDEIFAHPEIVMACNIQGGRLAFLRNRLCVDQGGASQMRTLCVLRALA